MLQLATNEVKDTLCLDILLLIRLGAELLEIERRELTSPSLLIKLLLCKTEHICLKTCLQIVEHSCCIEVLDSRADLKCLSSILNISHGVISRDDTSTSEDFNLWN